MRRTLGFSGKRRGEKRQKVKWIIITDTLIYIKKKKGIWCPTGPPKHMKSEDKYVVHLNTSPLARA